MKIIKKSKWNLFGENLDTLKSNRNIDHMEINKYWEIISNDISEAADKFIPKIKKGFKNPVPYWNDKCSEAVKERKHAKKSFKKQTATRLYCLQTKESFGKKKLNLPKKYWQTFCNSLNKNSNFNKIWKAVKKMKSNVNDNSLTTYLLLYLRL